MISSTEELKKERNKKAYLVGRWMKVGCPGKMSLKDALGRDWKNVAGKVVEFCEQDTKRFRHFYPFRKIRSLSLPSMRKKEYMYTKCKIFRWISKRQCLRLTLLLLCTMIQIYSCVLYPPNTIYKHVSLLLENAV